MTESFEDLYYAARRTIIELRRQLKAQRRYIDELEKQLEHSSPGLVKELREFLERNEQ